MWTTCSVPASALSLSSNPSVGPTLRLHASSPEQTWEILHHFASTPRNPPRWALASTVSSILSSLVSATQPRHFQGKASLFQAFPTLNEWAEETQIWIWPSYIYRGMLTLNRSNEQSINAAPLAPFFQLIPVMYLNVTFTMLWCFYSLYNVSE